MSWKKEIEELRKREKLAEEMGGPEKLKKQKENNKLNIRQRIKRLLDKDSDPKTASTFRSWTKVKVAGKAPDLNWIAISRALVALISLPYMYALPPEIALSAPGVISSSLSR